VRLPSLRVPAPKYISLSEESTQFQKHYKGENLVLEDKTANYLIKFELLDKYIRFKQNFNCYLDFGNEFGVNQLVYKDESIFRKWRGYFFCFIEDLSELRQEKWPT